MTFASAKAEYVSKMEDAAARAIETQFLRRSGMSKSIIEFETTSVIGRPRSGSVKEQVVAKEKQLDKEKMMKLLDHKIRNRSARTFLRDRNILHGGNNIAAQLVANQEALKKEQLRTTLEEKIDERPAPDDNLVVRMRTGEPQNMKREGSCKPIWQLTPDVDHRQKEGISDMINHRPSRSDLIDKNIIHSDSTPAFKNTLELRPGVTAKFHNHLSNHWSKETVQRRALGDES